VVEMAREFGDD